MASRTPGSRVRPSRSPPVRSGPTDLHCAIGSAQHRTDPSAAGRSGHVGPVARILRKIALVELRPRRIVPEADRRMGTDSHRRVHRHRSIPHRARQHAYVHAQAETLTLASVTGWSGLPSMKQPMMSCPEIEWIGTCLKCSRIQSNCTSNRIDPVLCKARSAGKLATSPGITPDSLSSCM